jgi:hypothetical protein
MIFSGMNDVLARKYGLLPVSLTVIVSPNACDQVIGFAVDFMNPEIRIERHSGIGAHFDGHSSSRRRYFPGASKLVSRTCRAVRA